jgi:glutathione-regulated potassium-efflux system ancillary protein KefG
VAPKTAIFKDGLTPYGPVLEKGGRMSEIGASDASPVLVVLAHPALERSRANRAMAAAADRLEGVSVHDLYEVYPDFLVDVDDEQARLVTHRNIVLQFPMYWYSMPSLLKEWIDQVWLHGFAYGKGGQALEGKTLLVACSSGSPMGDYQPGGLHHYSTDEFLRPLERTAALCKMQWAPPFVLHESRLLKPAALAEAVAFYTARLGGLATAVDA